MPRHNRKLLSQNARVSIALPVHNGGAHLREALESFQKQSYPHYELVICDNASTDDTQIVALEFSERDPRFIYKRQEEFLNARDNFIRAYRLTNSNNPYFLWACDDNVWAENFLLKTVEYMEGHPSCSLCGYFLYEFDEGGIRRTRRNRMPALYKWSRMLHILLERSSTVSIYALIRRRAIDRIELELREIDDYPDRYYLMQLRSRGYFHVVPEVLLGFRSGGISTTKDDSWVKTVIDLKFGESELATLRSFPAFSPLEHALIANKFTYQSLRHNISDTAFRWWLAPAHLAAFLMNWIRPSAWRVGPTGLEKRSS